MISSLRAEVIVSGDYNPLSIDDWINGSVEKTYSLGQNDDGSASLLINDSSEVEYHRLYGGFASGSNAQIDLLGGAKLTTRHSHLGFFAESFGKMTITGPSTVYQNQAIFTIGEFGHGEVLVDQGGIIVNSAAGLAVQANSTAKVKIVGKDSKWIPNNGALGTVSVGFAGKATFEVLDGASVETYQTYAGSQTGSEANIVVSGEGSSWTTQDDFSLRHGSIKISDGAHFESGSRFGVSVFNDGQVILDDGTIQTETFAVARDQLSGTGAITATGLDNNNYDFDLIFDGTNTIQKTITSNDGDNIDLTLTMDGTGDLDVGRLQIMNGAIIEVETMEIFREEAQAILEGSNTTLTVSEELRMGNAELMISNGASFNTEKAIIARYALGASITVTGSNSNWTNNSGLSLGNQGSGTIKVEDGARVQTDTAVVSYLGRTSSNISVSGENSVFEVNKNLYFADSGSEPKSQLSIAHGGQVLVGGNLEIGDQGQIFLEISQDDLLLSVTGEIQNEGSIYLLANLALSAGTYTPLVAGGSVINNGSIMGIGGTVNADYTFTVGSVMDGNGGISDQDLSGARLGFSFDVELEYSLMASFVGDAGIASFSVVELTPGQINNQSSLATFDFTTDLTDGTPVLLSFYLGEGLDIDLLSIWHKEDLGDWALFTPENITYQDGWLNFLVDGFSSYAVTIPEPSSTSLLALAGFGYLLRRRNNRQA